MQSIRPLYHDHNKKSISEVKNVTYLKRREKGQTATIGFTIRLSKDVHERLQEHAYKSKQSMTLALETLLDAALSAIDAPSETA